MKKLLFAMSFAAMGLMAAEVKGVISDSGCGAKHGPGKENVGCVNGCIKGKGAKPVLVTADGKVHAIHNADKVPADLYGKAVTVAGKVDGDSVHIDSIKGN
ncbi:MAG: hypothetical protein FJW30_22455 [Acidobacteria bacterium]|nr:hypothetical protein [Acidobacteriota bacterium]